MRIEPHPLAGTVAAIPSKSVAHRLILLAALADGTTDLALDGSSQDIDATLRCVQALGAYVGRTRQGLRIVPVGVRGPRKSPLLDVGESGSTLRFLLPVVAALGQGGRLVGQGRLAKRPLAPLDKELRAHGVALSEAGDFPLVLDGRLTGGRFTLPGNVSSQFASGLLMAAPLVEDDVFVDITKPIESRPYIDLTIDALAAFGVSVSEAQTISGRVSCSTFGIRGSQKLHSPGRLAVEGDWSNAAFWLAAGAIGPHELHVEKLNLASSQGDKAVMAALALMGARIQRGHDSVCCSCAAAEGQALDVSAIPDLAAPLAAVAATAHGTTRLCNAGRLRLKESDRLATISSAITALGGQARIEGDDLVIEGVEALRGGTVDAAGDHRIAMMAAICAACASEPTLIRGADCVAKSYPHFFDDFRALGGRAHPKED